MSSTGIFSAFSARFRAFMRCPGDEPEFARLALDLFALQFQHNAAYRAFCQTRQVSPGTIEHWSEIPALPASAFKELELSCLPPAERTVVFHSSGTTGQRPSRHFHHGPSLAIYECSLLPWFWRHLLPDCHLSAAHAQGIHSRKIADHSAIDNWQLAILTPPLSRTPHSSLVYMFETIRRASPAKESAFLGNVAADGSWTLDLEKTKKTLQLAAGHNRPLVLLGTAFGFVHLLEHLAEQDLSVKLPSGSRVLETGGYKGRSRVLPKSELHALFTSRLGVPAGYIICEYGMSELSSQAYDHRVGDQEVTRDEPAPRLASRVTRRFQFPPWCRVQIISPETGREVGEGQTGLIRVLDLANVYSVMAVQTEDLGVRRGPGFELLGRNALAEPRGCSLMAV